MKFILTGAKTICPGSDVMVITLRCAETHQDDVNTTITPGEGQHDGQDQGS